MYITTKHMYNILNICLFIMFFSYNSAFATEKVTSKSGKIIFLFSSNKRDDIIAGDKRTSSKMIIPIKYFNVIKEKEMIKEPRLLKVKLDYNIQDNHGIFVIYNMGSNKPFDLNIIDNKEEITIVDIKTNSFVFSNLKGALNLEIPINHESVVENKISIGFKRTNLAGSYWSPCDKEKKCSSNEFGIYIEAFKCEYKANLDVGIKKTALILKISKSNIGLKIIKNSNVNASEDVALSEIESARSILLTILLKIITHVGGSVSCQIIAISTNRQC